MSGKRLDKNERKQALKNRRTRNERDENIWKQLKENK